MLLQTYNFFLSRFIFRLLSFLDLLFRMLNLIKQNPSSRNKHHARHNQVFTLFCKYGMRVSSVPPGTRPYHSMASKLPHQACTKLSFHRHFICLNRQSKVETLSFKKIPVWLCGLSFARPWSAYKYALPLL